MGSTIMGDGADELDATTRSACMSNPRQPCRTQDISADQYRPAYTADQYSQDF
jgi:hypothetical protein